MQELDQKLVDLIVEKFDIKNDTAEGTIERLILSALQLERARVRFMELLPDADLLEQAEGLVELADIFDDANLDDEASEGLKAAVAKIVKTSTDEQKDAATDLFLSVLSVGQAGAEISEYLDLLIDEEVAEEPEEEEPAEEPEVEEPVEEPEIIIIEEPEVEEGEN